MGKKVICNLEYSGYLRLILNEIAEDCIIDSTEIMKESKEILDFYQCFTM